MFEEKFRNIIIEILEEIDKSNYSIKEIIDRLKEGKNF